MEDLKHRYFVRISFNGENYHGWQIQPNKITVQEVLEEKFSTILGNKIQIIGAGRTDSGVHARNYIFHFDINKSIDNIDKIIFRLNSFIPDNISIHQMWEVPGDLHARFDAIYRTYEYHIHIEKDPFIKSLSHYLYYTPDIEKMNKAATILLQYSDFTSFCKLHSDNTNNICKIISAEWTRDEYRFVFRICANRFLRNMVRAITGTMLEIGRNKLSIDQFKEIIDKKDRSAAGCSVPSNGLFFTEVAYPEFQIRQDSSA
ncbi:tRNA pseudouridine(38-40) synthase TruA [Bacteroidota bacterium]